MKLGLREKSQKMKLLYIKHMQKSFHQIFVNCQLQQV